MAGLTSVSGLMSGIQTDEIIAKMIEVERRPIQQYEAQQSILRTKLTTYREASTRLAAARDAAGTLASAPFFSSRTAAVSHPGLVSATAALGATPGVYNVTVEATARAHQVLSQSFADLDTTLVGTGTLSITAGGQTTAVTVDSSNNTLAGLRTAINSANGNVRASIVQDGDASYRLMISSKETGTASALTINSSLSGGASPTFVDLQAARDARVTMGEGANAITVERSTNSVQDLLPGVTLNLLAADPDTPITITVEQDRARIEEAVKKLVDQYNHAMEFVNQQFQFDLENGRGGALLGDYTLRSVQTDLGAVFSQTVAGISGSALSSVGITAGADGRLSLDAALFQERLLSDPEGVMKVFALSAKTTHAGVQFLSAGTAAVADGSSYAVEITQAARQARVTAGTALAGALGADETLTLNGVAVTLTAGMTQAEVLQAINARAKETGVRATATGADGTGTGSYLTFTTSSYGSRASVSVVSSRSGAGDDSSGIGNVAATEDAAGGETGAGTGHAGLDVAGTINGEAATGAGQVLQGAEGSTKTDGLRLRFTATTTGSLGTVSLYDGLANAARRTLDRITDTAAGPLTREEESLQKRLDDLEDIIEAREEAIQRKEEALRLKFNQLENALAEFQGQSAYLTSQLSAMQPKK